MKVETDVRKVKKLLASRYVERIFPSKETLKRFLTSGKRLTLYIGIDPTGPKLHLGHSSNFFLLKKFQELSHKIIFLIGDFTAQIGDPTGKTSSRITMTKKEILKNCKGYKVQAGKILNFITKNNPVEIKFNSKWLSKMNLEKMIDIAAKVTVRQLIKREMFKRRIKEKREIYLHEFLYPLFQGYDSVAMKADVEVGGNDQTFNMLIGRDLVKLYQAREELVLSTKLLINPKTKRKLMSKSEGNFVALDEKPKEMYGKIMALPDEVIITCFKLCTEVPDKKIQKIERGLKVRKINPREAKASLANEIVSIYHGKIKAKSAQKEFDRVFKKKKTPSNIPIFFTPNKSVSLVEFLANSDFVKSKSEVKRLILQGGVKIDNKTIKDWRQKIKIKDSAVVQIGKRRFIKIVSR